MSLNLMPAAPIENAETFLDQPQQAMMTLAQRGLYLPQQPGGTFTMPAQLSNLDDRSLGDLLNQANLWCGYVASELAQARTYLAAAEKKRDFIRAKIRLQVRASAEKKMSNPDKDDAVETDPRVVQAENEHLFHEARFSYIKVLLDNAQRDWETISRQITVRGQEVERHRRGENASTMPHVPMHSSTFRRQ